MSGSPTFESLHIDEDILSAISDLGYEHPTPIQASSIEKLLLGYDLIGQSRTGSGKTTAYAVPLIELIDPEDSAVQAVVLCPTRELSLQVTEELRKLYAYRPGIRASALFGGQPISRQIQELKKAPQILVATPGRFLDHLRRHTIRLSSVQMVVLDEADEMLQMGFLQDVDLILSQMPAPRQTVLFSATMPPEILALTQAYMEDPVLIRPSEEEILTVPEVEQAYFEAKPSQKEEALLRLLRLERPERCLVFCNTKKRAESLTAFLRDASCLAQALHGDLKQAQRDLSLRLFKNGDQPLLIATDVAARGLDIEDLSLVVNFDLPQEKEAYVHRIGRTARAGKGGKAFTLVTPKELPQLQELMKYTGKEILPRALPSLSELEKAELLTLQNAVLSRAEAHRSGNALLREKYLALGKAFLEGGHDPQITAAAFLQEIMEADRPSLSAFLSPPSSSTTRLSLPGEEKARLYIGAGKTRHVKVRDIIRFFSEEGALPSSELGTIDLFDTFCYVEVPSSLASSLVSDMNGKALLGHPVKVEIARS